MLKSMGPSAIDAEIRSLAPEAGGDLQLMKNFLDFVEAQLVTKKDFELVEAYLALFLKVMSLTLLLSKAINFKFPLQPHQKHKIAQYTKNLAFHSLLRWKTIMLPILTTSPAYKFLFGNLLFDLGGGRVKNRRVSHSPDRSAELFSSFCLLMFQASLGPQGKWRKNESWRSER